MPLNTTLENVYLIIIIIKYLFNVAESTTCTKRANERV